MQPDEPPHSVVRLYRLARGFVTAMNVVAKISEIANDCLGDTVSIAFGITKASNGCRYHILRWKCVSQSPFLPCVRGAIMVCG